MDIPLFDAKIVGVGLGRTGTNSLNDALNHLGIRTKHTPGPLTRAEVVSGDKHMAVLRDYDGIANGTATPYARIAYEYPNSKFILTVRRDTTAWLRSKERYAALELQNWSTFDPPLQKSKRVIRERIYGSFEFHAGLWLESYERHVRAVTDHFAGRPDRLLVMDIDSGDGWARLCPFVGVPVPTVAFPHANSLESATAWYARVSQLWADVDDCVGVDQPFVLVDDGVLGGNHRRSRPFLERDGKYWGAPADDRTAISELERMRGLGADFLVFAWMTFWWLGHYRAFRQHVSSRYTPVLQNDRVSIFDLRSPERSAP